MNIFFIIEVFGLLGITVELSGKKQRHTVKIAM